ncbi:MAG: putative selenium-dependent hydroxylase accessory protein YqeC [Deltaproteobacteria bacterium]|jgi:probable selenium-dependent hydroxylase accessory protein YqeC|nr:putative selenium-dependent hydroxylase accessory protein YqeC [Deltaproteobacteria bacterium]MBT4641144.1 putative selenium-dependent hydroxylase accessory protein YqeC [Deltaproteobacteria bacterium]MBT6504974.1 putative selenium-dependent hydroxylase accessory protein YqeC [Deltaproteobacteria bacterium]MBT7153957.1 putative selenium-dependent hydroxylase accessory protein YqeC [Deltaproteobacteria bacterium]MBT7712162.1 putative selenium-dependent hydroxylase accessory protein YqeC [Delt
MSSKERSKLSYILGLEKNSVIAVTGGGGKTTTIYTLAREVADEGWSVLITTTTAMLHPDLENRDYNQLFINNNGPLSDLEKKWGSGITVAARIFDYKTGKTLGFDPETINRLSAASIYDLILVEADGAKNRPIKAPADHEPVIPGSTDITLGLIGLDALDKPLNDDHVHRPQQLSALSGVPLDSPITGQVIESLIHSPLGIFKGSPATAKQVVILNKAAASDHACQGREIGEAVLANSDQIESVLICEMQSTNPVLDWIKAEKN